MIKDIIFDVDGVLLDWYAGFADFLGERLPEFKGAGKGGLRRLFPIHIQRGFLDIPMSLVDDFHKSAHYARLPVMEGAEAGIDKLHGQGGKRLFVCTSCGEEFGPMRRAYLMEKFGDKFEAVEIAFLMDKKAAVLAGMISKYGMDPGSTAFLDDMPANAVGGRRLGLVAIHMKTGFNIDVPFEFRDIPAVGSMDEFVRLISALDGNPQPRSSISGESARLLAGRSMGTAR